MNDIAPCLPESLDAATRRVLEAWVAREMGGGLTRLERQGRWRPAWFGTVRTGDGEQRIYVRGDRTNTGTASFTLEREYRVLRLLEEGGVKVPHVFGYIPELPVIVMEEVRGVHDLRNARSEAERESVRRQLAGEMARMHALAIEPFVEAGLIRPESPVAATMAYYDQAVLNAGSDILEANPSLAFLRKWIESNVPPEGNGPYFTACDAGQFMFDGGELTAMMDFELAMLGDPMQDLAFLRRRTTYEPLGDIPSLLDMYEQASGKPLDRGLIRFHTVASATAAVMGSTTILHAFLAAPGADGNLVETLNWVNNSTKQAFEGIAEISGFAMPDIRLPEARASLAGQAVAAARATADGLGEVGGFDAYRKRSLQANLAYQDRLARHGRQFENDYLADAADLLGQRPRDRAEADAMLAGAVDRAPAGDEALFGVLYAESLRRCLLLAIPGSTYLHGLTQPAQPLVRQDKEAL